MKVNVVSDSGTKEIDAPTIEDAFQTVKSQVEPTKVLEVQEATKTIIVKDVVTG